METLKKSDHSMLKSEIGLNECKMHDIPVEKIMRIVNLSKKNVEHIKERLSWNVLNVQNDLVGNLRRKIKKK